MTAGLEPTSADIRRAQKGSAADFEKIVTYYLPKIYNFALRFTYDRVEAEDITQEIFQRLYIKLREYDPARPFRPWLYRLAANACINATRGRARAPLVEDPEVLEGRRHGDERDDPAASAAARDEVASLQRAVAQLPEDYRTVVVMRYVEDMTCEEVAESLDLPVGTVKTWLYRAREILKRKLAHED